MLLPFLLITFVYFFHKTDLREPNVFGGNGFVVSLLGITSYGSIKLIWNRLEFLITPIVFFPIFGIIIGILVLFNTSLDQLIAFITKALITIKRYFISERKVKKPPVYLTDEKDRKQEDGPIEATQLSLDDKTLEDEVPGPPPVLKEQSSSRIEDMDGLLTMSDRQRLEISSLIFLKIFLAEADREMLRIMRQNRENLDSLELWPES